MAEPPSIKRNYQRIGGAVMVLISLGGIALVWYTAFAKSYVLVYASMVFPAFFFVGLGVIFFKNYKTERVERGEDISQLEGWRLITARWWAILVLGILAGLANFALLYF